jgi:hypothetical protein
MKSHVLSFYVLYIKFYIQILSSIFKIFLISYVIFINTFLHEFKYKPYAIVSFILMPIIFKKNRVIASHVPLSGSREYCTCKIFNTIIPIFLRNIDKGR